MKEIIAKEGHYLTQSAEVVDERLFLTAIKGETINENDWREATEEEKLAFEEQQENARKAKEQMNNE